VKSIFPFSSFIKRFSIPLLLLAVTLLAYGWQVGKLGFYWDDWVFVYRYQTLGLLHTVFYGGMRQLGVLALLPGFLFAGDSPFLWHIYSLLLRWVTALLVWWGLARLWPAHKTAVVLMAALFAVYPAFSQQSIAVVYSLQFFTYATFLASFGFMLQAERAGSRRWLWYLLALAAQGLHLFIVEYFVGLELIRPLALYFIQGSETRWSRIKSTLLHWSPYLIILALYALLRSGTFSGGFVDYDFKTITALFQTDPRAAIFETFEYGLKDILVVLVKTWTDTLAPSIVDLAQPYNFLSLLVAALSAFGLYFALSRPRFDGETPESGRFLAQAAALGLLAVLVGFIPAWFVRRHIVEPGNFGDRFALASLLGASILLVALIRFFAGQRERGILLASLFVGLAIGAQMRYSNSYRWDWERQLRTYWQVYWRAPALKEGTVLVGFNAISTTAVNYIGAFAFNDFYGLTPGQPHLWYVNYPKTHIPDNLDKFLSGEWFFVAGSDWIQIPVTPQHSLGVDYDTPGRCVRLLVPGDPSLSDLPADFQPVAGFSNPALIQPESSATPPEGQGGAFPPRHIFGPEPAPDWCYYFQKASLARQFGDWEQVIALKQQADKAGFEPLNPDEMFPFIEAYARSGDLAKAEKLTMQTYNLAHKTRAGLCQLWAGLGQPAPGELGCE
jgi:hypothetical protein